MNVQNISKYIESARLHVLENPLHGLAVASAALLGASFLFCNTRHLRIKPEESIIVITGCDSGFGSMACKKLSSLGYLVVAGCLMEQSVKSLESIAALPIRCDITKEEDRARLVAATEKLAKDRGARLWTLVNNAGIASGGCIDWVPTAACRKVMEVNFFGLFEVTRAFLPLLKRTKDSRIINISSAAGLVGSWSMGVYCASKHAVEGLGKTLRQELEPWNVHVCHINPGFMNTPILQASYEESVRDLGESSQEVLAQYDPASIDALRHAIDRLKDNPEKVVSKIVHNVTAARPLFNNPVGNGTYTLWCALCFLPQRWMWQLITWSSRVEGYGPRPEAVRSIQQGC